MLELILVYLNLSTVEFAHIMKKMKKYVML